MKDLIAKLKTALKTLQLSDDQRKEIETQITELEKAAEKVPAPTPTPAPAATPATTPVVLPPEVTAALAEINTLKDMLVKQEQRAKDAEKAMADKLAADKKKQLDDYVKKVTETEMKITPAEMTEKWKPLLEANFEATSKIIDAMPVNPAAKKGTPKGGEQKSGDVNHPATHDDYMKNKDALVDAARAAFAATEN